MKLSQKSIQDFSGNEYQVVVGADTANKKAPITVYVVQSGCNPGIGCYTYSINHPTTNQVYTSVLQASDNHLVHDLSHNLSRILVKKWACPAYVCISGLHFDMAESPGLIRQVVDMIA